MLKVYTSQYRYKGKNRLDITVKSGLQFLAPTWDMVMQYKHGVISEIEYEIQYRAKMKKSYKEQRPLWDELLSRDEVVLVCFCRKGDFCHRLLLANMLQNWFGCEYLGEISNEKEKSK
jgi:uncharacterized protein YeaO (DUF488 family)